MKWPPSFSFEKICTLTAAVGILMLFILLSTLSAEEVHPFVALHDPTEEAIQIRGTVQKVIPKNESMVLILHSTIEVPVTFKKTSFPPSNIIGATIEVQGTLGGNVTDPIIFGSDIRLR